MTKTNKWIRIDDEIFIKISHQFCNTFWVQKIQSLKREDFNVATKPRKKNVYYQAQTMKEVGLLRTRIDLFGGRWIHSQNGFPCLNNKSNERRLKGKPLDLERGGRWWLGSRLEVVRLSSQSVWQIVTQISWARLLVQPTLGIDQCWL